MHVLDTTLTSPLTPEGKKVVSAEDSVRLQRMIGELLNTLIDTSKVFSSDVFSSALDLVESLLITISNRCLADGSSALNLEKLSEVFVSLYRTPNVKEMVLDFARRNLDNRSKLEFAAIINSIVRATVEDLSSESLSSLEQTYLLKQVMEKFARNEDTLRTLFQGFEASLNSTLEISAQGVNVYSRFHLGEVAEFFESSIGKGQPIFRRVALEFASRNLSKANTRPDEFRSPILGIMRGFHSLSEDLWFEAYTLYTDLLADLETQATHSDMTLSGGAFNKQKLEFLIYSPFSRAVGFRHRVFKLLQDLVALHNISYADIYYCVNHPADELLISPVYEKWLTGMIKRFIRSSSRLFENPEEAKAQRQTEVEYYFAVLEA